MYVQVGDFHVSRGLATVPPLTRISCNMVFSKSQNARKAGTLCSKSLVKLKRFEMPHFVVAPSSVECVPKGFHVNFGQIILSNKGHKTVEIVIQNNLAH